MSVRIYQLSKELGMENAELLELLKERGFSVKSASSTVDNISADSLKEEFANKAPAEEGDAKASDSSATEGSEPTSKAPPAAPSIASFVRSKDDIAKEKEEAKAAAAPKPAAPPPPPQAPKPPAPAPAAPAPAAPPKAPGIASPPPMAAPRVSPPSVSPPSVKVKPAPEAPKVAAPVSVTPPPVNAAPAAPKPAGPPAPPSPPSPGSAKGPESASPVSVAPPSVKTASSEASSDDIKHIVLKPPIVVRDFAGELGVKPFKLISELMEMGIFASINQSLEEEVASQLAEKHGFLLEIRHRGEGQKSKKKEVKVVDESELLEPRPAVVCIMGHVDHGKTSLLDFIRKANVTKSEAGGITQHIGAYQVEHAGHKITFLDTPGHAAFNAMRERGADVTDIAILIVAADDGFKPQTDEALKFIQKAGVQPIVAINKIDTKGANIEKVKQEMQARGIASEDWGGEILCVPVSAIKGDGVEELLDNINLQSEVLELKANPKKPAEGVIIEASIEVGRGATATVIISAGTLKIGDALVCGACYTKVKAMFNEYGKPVKVAPPSTPVRIIGWSGTPDCGATFVTVKNEKVAKVLAADNEIDIKAEIAAIANESDLTPQERLFAAIAKTKKKTLRLILKGDTFGSVEAINQALKEITSEKVALDVIGSGVGIINKSDVQKASAGEAEIIGFNVKSDNGVAALAKNHSVKVSSYQIIYELIDRVREDMVEMLDPEYRENKIGAAEVRAVFPIAKGFVAGCLVTEGRVQNGAKARVLRRNQVQIESKISEVRRVKDVVKEVRAGTECGIQIANFNDYKEGDVIEVFETHEIRPAL